ncbi:hypothetical protein D9M71_419030 [compost metagenome]
METKTFGPAELAQMLAEQKAARTQRLEAGIPALDRLVAVAQRDTGQSEVCGRFLLGVYNGPFYRFDLTELRRLDNELLEDCLAVLRMDANPVKEVHRLIDDGDSVFRQLRMFWATSAEVANWPEEDKSEWQSYRN